jgi:hypothetical protein
VSGPGGGAWPGPALLVPVGVDALVLTEAAYNAGWSWIPPDYLSAQSFTSKSRLFQQSPPALRPAPGSTDSRHGVVVRWALPDALTAGGAADEQTGAVTFPPIPNRWLVARQLPGSPGTATAWVLASDYLGGDGAPFYHGGAPTALGLAWTLADWPGEAALPAGLQPPLTAVGLGDPTFAAYLPDLQHVLAFYDPLTGVPAGKVSYFVCGWYGGGVVDPLSGTADGTGSWQTPTDWAALMDKLGWSLGADLKAAEVDAADWATAHGYTVDQASPRSFLPARTVCHGLVCGVNWPGPAGPVQSGVPTVNPADQNTIPRVTHAHTAADALAATVGGGAGTPEAEALGAVLTNLVALLDQPDGGAQLAARLQGTWFQQSPGGTSWQVAPVRKADVANSPPPVTLTAAQAAVLDALNAAQQDLDATTRQVASLQWDIYALWWKASYVTANQVSPIANAQQVISDALAAKQQAATAALGQRQAAAANRDAAVSELTAQLDVSLALQQVPEPPFWRPNDPVALIQGAGRSYQHGEDGRFTVDGSLYCRFTGQTVNGLLVTGTTSPVTAQTLGLSPLSVADGPAEIADLMAEAYFLDTGNAHTIAAVARPGAPPPALVVAAQQTLVWNSLASTLDQQTTAQVAGLQSPYGPVAVPSKVAVEYWTPPWAPLYLDWQATYYPTSPPTVGWTFPAPTQATPLATQTAQWTGTLPAAGVPVQGRSVLTPQASDALATRLAQLAADAGDTPDLQPYLSDITAAVNYLTDASVLSQALSGLGEQLLQRDPAVIQQPDLTALGQWLAPPGGPSFTPAAVPVPDSPIPLSPVRAGFLHLDKAWVVDDFGQYYDVLGTIQQFPQLGGEELALDVGPSPQESWLALRPRLTQPSRLRLRFLDAADDALVTGLSAAARPVCGWLVPNRLDNSVMIYDAAGVLQGELLLAQAQASWLPAPDLAPPAAQAAMPSLGNAHLQALVSGVLAASSPAAALADLLTTIENASWAITPSGPDGPQLSTLIGFPVAVARAQLLLELAGNPATSQLWADTGADNDGGISTAIFPVELGSAELDDDGLVAFFADASLGRSLSSTYAPAGSGYVTASPATVTAGQPLALTLLLHPQGTVHAFTGLLPPVTATLPAPFQAAPTQAMEVTFRAGPLLTPPTAVTVPLPAFGAGDWAWLQYDSADSPALPRALTRADATARLPDTPPGLRDGWLRLALGGQGTALRYALTPEALPTGHGGAPASSLTLTAYNATSSPVTCDSITVTLPVDPDAGALTGSPGLIQPVSGQPDWTFTAASPNLPGTCAFTASPIVPGAVVPPGATLAFTLSSLGVSPAQGLSAVTVQEATAGGAATVTLPVERFNAFPGSQP